MLQISPFCTFFNVIVNCNTFDLAALTDLILFYFNLLYYWSNLTEFWFLYMLSLFARHQVKTMIVKFRKLPMKTSILGISLTFFINRMFSMQTAQYCDNLSKVVEVTLFIQITKFCGKLSKAVGKISQPTILFLKVVGC